jgi:putative endonuclease
MYFVYLLSCADKTIYTGITTDVRRRFSEHKKGAGGHYTRSRKPVKILYTEKYPNRSSASKREAAIKRMPRAEKLKLIKASRAEVRHSRASKKAKGML